MTKQVDFQKYTKFVDAVTSDESKDFLALSDRLVRLDEKGRTSNDLWPAININAEGGEVMEIVKKLVFQGKPWNDETKKHLIKEVQVTPCVRYPMSNPLEKYLSMRWLWQCFKTWNRYPGGIFDPWYSENRQEGDL